MKNLDSSLPGRQASSGDKADVSRLAVVLAKPGFAETLIFITAVLVFMGSAGFAFLYDDRIQIVANQGIRSWHGVLHYFGSDVWHDFNPDNPQKYYRPLFFVWFRINYLLFKLNPAGWHFASILLHGVVSVLAFRVALNLTGNRMAGIVAGLLFALHPIHIESVAWVSGCTDPLMSLFLLSAVLMFFRWLRSGRPVELGATALFYLLALLCKETAIMLFPVLAVLGWLYSPETGRRARMGGLLKGLAPLGALTFAYAAVRASLFHRAFGGANALPAKTVLYSFPEVALFYLRQALVPAGLSFAYELSPQQNASVEFFWMPVLVLAAVMGLCVCWCYRSPSHRRVIVASLVIFWGWLLPVVNIRFMDSSDLVHDRYLYLPVLGLCILAGVLIQQWSEVSEQKSGVLQVGAVGAVSVLLFLATGIQQMNYASELQLWTQAVRVSPSSHMAVSNLGIVLYEKGYMDQGLRLFLQEIQRQPNSSRVNYCVAFGLYSKHEYKAAEPYALQALELALDEADYNRLYGLVQFQLGKDKAAEVYLQRALTLNPRNAGLHKTLGSMLLKRGDRAGAEREFAQELELFPSDREALELRDQVRGADSVQ